MSPELPSEENLDEYALQTNLETCQWAATDPGVWFLHIDLIGESGLVYGLDHPCDDRNRAMLDRLYQELGIDTAQAEVENLTRLGRRSEGPIKAISPEYQEMLEKLAEDEQQHRHEIHKDIPTTLGIKISEHFVRKGNWQSFWVSVIRTDEE